MGSYFSPPLTHKRFRLFLIKTQIIHTHITFKWGGFARGGFARDGFASYGFARDKSVQGGLKLMFR
jgi:hypothetical protein